MNKCDCYDEQTKISGWLGPDEVIRKTVCVCNGTREQDVCSCGGDRTKCDFYPEVRQKENKPMKAKIVVEGKEFPIEILDPELEKLIKPQKKTGYERVEDGQSFWCVENDAIMPCRDVHGDCDVQSIYDSANYYSNFEVVTNNARADRLMRQLRRFAVEHREKELNWDNDGLCSKKYCICYRYDEGRLICTWDAHVRVPFLMYFDSEASCKLAIETFRDELLWYFTEYEDSL
jgi:hypothetical protein